MLSVAFGVHCVLPGAGALTVVVRISAYALVTGVLLVAFALRLRRWHKASGDAGAP